MQRRLWIGLVVLALVFGLAFTTGCAKKAVKAGPADRTADLEDQDTRYKAEQERMAAQKKAEEERRRLQRLEEERLRQQQMEQERETRQEYLEGREGFMEENIHFAFDSAVLSEKAQDILREKAAWLKAHPDDNVLIEGHADERGSNEYNLALGDRRAQAAKNFLVDLGIDPMRIDTISYGEERPIDPRSNEEAWAKNRRAHFVLK
ncbi:MAG: peptidoglycan-associated lipoprotein Pal [Desulfatibacillaceae bacterium]